MKNVYNENELLDYMWRLRSIIAAIPEEQKSNEYVSPKEFEKILIKDEELNINNFWQV